MLRQSTRLRTVFRRSAYLSAGIGGIYVVDRQYNASALTRTLRTLYTCAMITLDYKLNFTPEKSHLIPELHQRVADRMYNLFTANAGLYIKIGQALGANAAFLPRPIQLQFAKLFDDAPQIPYSEVLSVFRSEFGGRNPGGPGGVFEIFEEDAIASASIAQVHKAKLWPIPGDESSQDKWVAVKIQKPAVAKQMEWDLGAYKAVLWMFEHWVFDLPVYFVADFITSHLRRELDFVLEAESAKKTAAFIASEPSLSSSVYVPQVYEEFSTRRVMTAEWIEGVRMSDRDGVYRLLGETPPHATTTAPRQEPILQGGTRSILQTMVDLFSAQMFMFGFVHCDPHPGNVIIRPNPSKPSLPQLVLLDHGLYVSLSDKLRIQWSTLWRALLVGDYRTIEHITEEWGVGLPDLFASAIVMNRYKFQESTERQQKRKEAKNSEQQTEPDRELTQYEQSVKMKAMLKEFLTDADRMPKELTFLMRNMRIVQGNNQSFGSPVNRIKITGLWASRALFVSPSTSPSIPLASQSLVVRLTRSLKSQTSSLIFHSVLFSLDVLFYLTRFRQWLGTQLTRVGIWGGGVIGSGGFEDELEKSIQGFAKGQFGVELGPDAFQG